jgi:hypothetical protein
MQKETLEILGGPRDGEFMEVESGAWYYEVLTCERSSPVADIDWANVPPIAPAVRVARYVRSSLWRGFGPGKPSQKIADVLRWDGER